MWVASVEVRPPSCLRMKLQSTILCLGYICGSEASRLPDNETSINLVVSSNIEVKVTDNQP